MNSANQDRAGFAALDPRKLMRRKKALTDRKRVAARIQLGLRVVATGSSGFGKRARSPGQDFKRGGVRWIHAKAGIEW